MRVGWQGWIAAAWLMAGGLALGQAPAKDSPLYILPNTYIQVPFTVTSVPQPTEVQVYISWNRGQSWSLYERLAPEAKHFDFRPKQDGEYWFATRVLERGRPAADSSPKAPQCRIVIDTTKPQLEIAANVDAQGQVDLVWKAYDVHLKPASLVVEYQDATGVGGPWNAVQFDSTKSAAAPGTLSGRMAFLPIVPSQQINLRAEVVDSAGNKAYFSKQISLARKPKAQDTAGGRPAADLAAKPWPIENRLATAPPRDATPLASDATPTASDATAEAGDAPQLVRNPYSRTDRFAGLSSDSGASEDRSPEPIGSDEVEAEPLPPPVTPSSPRPQFSSSTPRPSTPDFTPLPPPQEPLSSLPADVPETSSEPPPAAQGEELYPPASPAPLPAGNSNSGSGYSGGGYSESAAEPIEPGFSPPSYAPAESVSPRYSTPVEPAPQESLEPPSGERPRLTNTRRFSLEYDVESVGPEGVADVELWGTNDGGRTWMKWGTDPDRASPFDVEVSNESQYGFRVVIIGRNGLVGNTPQPGDTADIWVGVDLTKPVARMTQAAYGVGENAGKLDIRWEAADASLSARPITISFAEQPAGPYTIIAAGLPNSGQYLWEFDPRSPRQIYLRLEVRDDAGNIAIDQLRDPINVEGLAPKGRIRNLTPNSDTPRGAFRTPLFR